MSEALPSGTTIEAGPTILADPVRASRRPLVAAFLSALVPGTGQIFLKQRRRGVTDLALFAGLLLCFWPLRVLRFYAGFLGLYGSWVALYIYAASTAALSLHPSDSKRRSKWWLAAVLPVTCVTLSLVGALVTRAAGFRSFIIPSSSMETTIRQGDHIVVDSFFFKSRTPSRKDLLVFQQQGSFFIKRVVAIGGDSVLGKAGRIFVNGQALAEPYARHTGDPPIWMNDFGPVRVPIGGLFVLGDNRDVSLDSRSWEFGFVSVRSIVGKPLYVFGSDRNGKNIR